MDCEKEETLSFCDLQIYSDDPMPSDEARSSFSSSYSSLNQDFFGFLPEEWSSTTTTTTTSTNFSSSISTNPPNNILFCGKVIHTSKRTESKNSQKQKAADDHKADNSKKKSLFRWNSDSFNKSSNGVSQASTLRTKSLPVPERKEIDTKNDVLAQRVSKLASPSKSRWQVFMFGWSGKFPAKMELSDLRSRQLKRSPSTIFQRQDAGKEDKSAPQTSGRRLSGLIRVLGCSAGFNTEEMMKASFGYVPPV